MEIDNGIGVKESQFYWKDIFGCKLKTRKPSASDQLREGHLKLVDFMALGSARKPQLMEGFSFDKDSVS